MFLLFNFHFFPPHSCVCGLPGVLSSWAVGSVSGMRLWVLGAVIKKMPQYVEPEDTAGQNSHRVQCVTILSLIWKPQEL